MGTLGKTWRPGWYDIEALKARLLRKRKVLESGCWVYGDHHGYAQIRVEGQKIGVHIVAAWVWNEVPPSFSRVDITMHTCDNPPCFNPEHVKRATQWDNIQDSIAKGRR